jgi:tetratricopeptide (TPR) repeat protein
MEDSPEYTHKLFQEGLIRLRKKDAVGALNYFQNAFEINVDKEIAPSIKSYLGYTLALAKGQEMKGIQLMREALHQDYTRAEHFLNLGKVYLEIQKDRRRAIQVFWKGLKHCPYNSELQDMIHRLGIRRAAPLKCFRRGNIVNRTLGRFLHRKVATVGTGS